MVSIVDEFKEINLHLVESPDDLGSEAYSYHTMRHELTKYMKDKVVRIESDEDIEYNLNNGIYSLLGDGKKLLAFCLVCPKGKCTTPNEVYIGLIIVKDDYRRKGVGTAFLNHLCIYLRSKGYTKITLDVDSDDPIAVAFYEKFQKLCLSEDIVEEVCLDS